MLRFIRLHLAICAIIDVPLAIKSTYIIYSQPQKCFEVDYNFLFISYQLDLLALCG